MKYLWLLVLPLALASSGCAWQDFPVHIYLESSFSDLECEAILDAADEWNEVVGSCLAEPGPLIVYEGRIEDDFNENDFGDDIHVIYRISEPGTDAEFLAEDNDGSIAGHATLGDVVLFLYREDTRLAATEASAAAEGTELDTGEWRYRFVRNIALHEFGHLLGITHYECYTGTMNSDEPRVYDEQGYRYLNDCDRRAFCAVYDCLD